MAMPTLWGALAKEGRLDGLIGAPVMSKVWRGCPATGSSKRWNVNNCIEIFHVVLFCQGGWDCVPNRCHLLRPVVELTLHF